MTRRKSLRRGDGAMVTADPGPPELAGARLDRDQDEVLFDAARPVILNGIEDIVTRPDLADRAMLLTLEPIPEERRRPEAELSAAFEAESPRILGVLLDAVVEGLKRLSATHLPKLPRMADFALWATACETALWPAGTFWSAYCGNRDEAVEGVIDADPIAAAVRATMATGMEWTGTASLVGLLRQPRRGGRGRHRRRPDHRRRARHHGDRDGVDGNGLGASEYPRGNGGRACRQVQNLAR
jgi:hypothetical protein